jgi:hypothetical protein
MTKQQEQLAKKYQELTGRLLSELPDGKVQYIEKRKTGQVKVKRNWSEIEQYINLKSKSITTSSNKNIVKIVGKNILINIAKTKKEKFMNASCSIKKSEYERLKQFVEKHNTTINKLLQQFVRQTLQDSYK